MNKYEQLIEHIINDDEAKARALFHQIVVEKSRDIYESLMDEEYAEEDIHAGNPVESMMDEITGDETYQAEEEELKSHKLVERYKLHPNFELMKI